jgi:hypothetical protein
MCTILSILALLASALAAPTMISPSPFAAVVAPETHTGTNLFSPIVTRDNDAEQALRCDVDYCTKLANACVKSCESLSNGDWYVLEERERESQDVVLIVESSFFFNSSPSCEMCRIEIVGC